MPILIVEHRGKTRGAALPTRLLIGRRSMNHLVIDDPAVSRMHAWIDHLGAAYYLTDMHSRTGTRVNGQPVAQQQQQLFDGDVIEIGSARLTFRDSEEVPPGVKRFELPREPAVSARDTGIRFNCPQCTAPLWAGLQFAGHVGECTYCGEAFTVPSPASIPTPAKTSTSAKTAAQAKAPARVPAPVTTATPVAGQPGPPASPELDRVAESAPSPRCGVCQSPVLLIEARTTCPACGLVFHEECWQENYGCSAYGCSQVDILKPPEPEPAANALAAEQGTSAMADVDAPPRTPWEFILLGASAVAVLVSAVSFGAASAIALLVAVIYWVKGKHSSERKRGAIFGAMALSVVGIAAGIALSYYLFVYSGGWRRP